MGSQKCTYLVMFLTLLVGKLNSSIIDCSSGWTASLTELDGGIKVLK